MNHKEKVKGKITGKGNELDQRKELWEKISSAYDIIGGEDAIKSVLIQDSDSISQEFDKLLRQLREKL